VILRRLPPHCLAIRVLRLEPVRRATTLDAGFTGYVAFCRAHELTPADARRILINGATGFVGELGAEDARAWTRGPRDRARSPNGRPARQPPSFDLLDAEAPRGSQKRRVPNSLHFAGPAALPQETDEAEIFLHTVQPLNLASTCTGCELFIYAGSSSEYDYQTRPGARRRFPI
jgi:nucleoside-diphosphate-sugar epimerase